jgi:uncharacterized protein YabN with tetrapyrrole methylase and pyrophosphatase domain
VLDPDPREGAPLRRALVLTERARRVGFDWPSVAEVLDKLSEEVDELRCAVAAGRPDEAAAELGDVLFAVANVARFLAVDPDAALAHATDRFVARFRWIEARLREQGRRPEDEPLEALDALWNAAKRAGVGVVGGREGPSTD